jgi:hypothetical protein
MVADQKNQKVAEAYIAEGFILKPTPNWDDWNGMG